MSTYAQIIDGMVVNTIVADADFIETQTEKTYVICNKGGIGWTFDGTNFVAPQPYPSWILDEFTCQWKAYSQGRSCGDR